MHNLDKKEIRIQEKLADVKDDESAIQGSGADDSRRIEHEFFLLQNSRRLWRSEWQYAKETTLERPDGGLILTKRDNRKKRILKSPEEVIYEKEARLEEIRRRQKEKERWWQERPAAQRRLEEKEKENEARRKKQQKEAIQRLNERLQTAAIS
jgi:hypothetical protein